jgi:hypothetical protein
MEASVLCFLEPGYDKRGDGDGNMVGSNRRAAHMAVAA